jgi:hypothetical protein
MASSWCRNLRFSNHVQTMTRAYRGNIHRKAHAIEAAKPLMLRERIPRIEHHVFALAITIRGRKSLRRYLDARASLASDSDRQFH